VSWRVLDKRRGTREGGAKEDQASRRGQTPPSRLERQVPPQLRLIPARLAATVGPSLGGSPQAAFETSQAGRGHVKFSASSLRPLDIGMSDKMRLHLTENSMAVSRCFPLRHGARDGVRRQLCWIGPSGFG
jgi:hypothetical protein